MRAPAFLLISSFVLAACGDSGGSTDVGTTDLGPADAGFVECDPIPTSALNAVGTIGTGTVTASFNITCNPEEGDRDHHLFQEGAQTVDVLIVCEGRDTLGQYGIDIRVHGKVMPEAKQYTDPKEFSVQVDEGFMLGSLNFSATNARDAQVTVDCFDRQNLRISGSFSGTFPPGTGFGEGSGEVTGSFATNLTL